MKDSEEGELPVELPAELPVELPVEPHPTYHGLRLHGQWGPHG